MKESTYDIIKAMRAELNAICAEAAEAEEAARGEAEKTASPRGENMVRVYYFSIWTADGEHFLYDGVFLNAAEALAFIRDNKEDADTASIRIDGINFVDTSLLDAENWCIKGPTSWYNYNPIKVPA